MLSVIASKRAAVLALAIGVFVSATPARAQEGAVPLTDPTYLPGEGHFISDTEFSYERYGFRQYQPGFSFGPAGPQITGLTLDARVRSDAYAARQSVEYGLIDDLVVGLGESCEQATQRDSYVGYDSVLRTRQAGCGNPDFFAIYRAVRQSGPFLPVNIDLAASYLPDLVSVNSGSPLATARTQGDVNLAVSRVFDGFTLLGRAGVEIWGGSSIGTGESVQTQSATHRFYGDFQAQYRPDDAVALIAGVQTYSGLSYDVQESFAGFGSGYHERDGLSYAPHVEASWLIIPNFLAVSLQYQHSFDGKQSVYDAVLGTILWQNRHVGSDLVAVDFRVLWF